MITLQETNILDRYCFRTTDNKLQRLTQYNEPAPSQYSHSGPG